MRSSSRWLPNMLSSFLTAGGGPEPLPVGFICMAQALSYIQDNSHTRFVEVPAWQERILSGRPAATCIVADLPAAPYQEDKLCRGKRLLHQGLALPELLTDLKGANLCAAHQLQRRLKDQPDRNLTDSGTQPFHLPSTAAMCQAKVPLKGIAKGAGFVIYSSQLAALPDHSQITGSRRTHQPRPALPQLVPCWGPGLYR